MGDKQLRYRSKSPGMCTEMFRGLLMFVNIALALGSLTVVGILGYVQAKSSKHVSDVCHSCTDIVIFSIALFCTLFVFAMIGFCALYKRNTCLLLIYGFYLLVFFLGALAITIVFMMVKSGDFDGRMQEVWDDAVRTNSDNLCNLQEDVDCSGWKVLCNSTTPYQSNNTLGCPSCSDVQQLVIANLTKTCYVALSESIDTWYKPIIITGFSLAGLALISIIVTYRVRKTDDDDDDHGTYTRM